MPRPKKIGGPEPKTRSRNGCWPCKAKKVKCGEEKPSCLNCKRQGEACDYSIRLNWDGRTKRKADGGSPEPASPLQASRASCLPGATSLTIKFAGPPAQTSPPKLGSTDAGKQSNATASQSEDQDRNHELLPWQHSNLSGTTTQPRSNSLFRSYQPSMIATPATEITVIDPALADAGKPPTSDSGSPHAPNGAALHGDLADNRQAGSYMTRGGRSSADGPPRLKDPSDSIIYPSPTVSNCVSPGLNGRPTSNHNSTAQSASTACMLPPYDVPLSNPHIISRKDHVYTFSPDNRAKRITLNPILVSANPVEKSELHAYDTSSADNGYDARSRIVTPLPPYSPYNSNIGTPLTPASPSVASEHANQHITVGPSPTAPRESLDVRRLSVSSLLSGPPEKDGSRTATHAEQFSTFSFYPVRDVGTATVTYGLDRGFPDLDVSKNNDTNAINDMSPAMINDEKEMMLQHRFGDGYYVPTEFGFGLQAKDTNFGKGGYYAKPVPVKIPRSLEPLPPTLLQNPMNLLYFHHFLNHTARILVPHDCSENPFRKILPQMALENINLLNLLLAYSASHRARLLNHPEPANRIALWVQDVFPALRLALYDSREKISNANLATAIMLASLEIISPNTFEVPVPWQNHLNTARRILIARGGAQSVHRQDKVSYFLSRWFAYLDVLGSLSGSKNDRPLFSGNYWANDDLDDENDFQIDCLLGFTSRCVSILAKIAELARQCDSERIDGNGNIRKAWTPSTDTVEAAEKLQRDLQEARTHVYKGCAHRHSQSSESEEGWDSLEMVATNDAFHWAGLVHLHRRVLGKSSLDPEVQNAVREIVGALYKVRKGGTAEACLLFPMFTAGCDARDQAQREKIMERIRSVEGFGMTQVHKARTLMQKVWDTGKPWETLVTGEFFG